jgi:DNA gyrase subunit A
VVVTRRTQFQLKKALERLEIVEGLSIALRHLDEVIALIRRSQTADEARGGLMQNFGLSERQAQAILDLRLHRLTGLEREKVEAERRDLEERIAYLNTLLSNENLLRDVIRKELSEYKIKFGDARRTQIIGPAPEFRKEDTIPDEDAVITLTHRGYIKRIPLNAYRGQHRGGRGVTALTTRSEDFVEQLFVTTTLHYLLFFTNKGKVYRLRVYDLPEGSRQAKGTALVNLLPFAGDEDVTAVIPLREFDDNSYIFMATKLGIAKKGRLAEYDSARRDGIIAIRLRDDDELIGAKLTNGKNDVILATRDGLAICFAEDEVRPTGRATSGVHGIRLRGDDEVVGMERKESSGDLLVVSEYGYGKRTSLKSYRRQGRGGKGVTTLRLTDRNGRLVGIKVAGSDDEVLLMSSEGIVIRIPVGEVSRQGRSTQGVRVMRMDKGDKVVAVAKLPPATLKEI